MTKIILALCAVVGASLGLIAGEDHHAATAARSALTRSSALRDEAEHLRVRFDAVRREIDAAQTEAAAAAARAKLFQLRVDMVAVEDELAVLTRRRPAARDF